MRIIGRSENESAKLVSKVLMKLPISKDRKRVLKVYCKLIDLQELSYKEEWVDEDKRLCAVLDWQAPKGNGFKIYSQIFPMLQAVRPGHFAGVRLLKKVAQNWKKEEPLLTGMWFGGLRQRLKTKHNGTDERADKIVKEIQNLCGGDN